MYIKQLFDCLTAIKPYQYHSSQAAGLSEMGESIIQDSIKSTFNNHLTKTNNLLTTIIYLTNNKQYDTLKELLELTGDTEDSATQLIDDDYTRIALLFPNVNSIIIPKKAKRNISRYVPKHLLKAIDSDLNKAIEKCLVFLSYLSPTYYTENKWKPLSSIQLHEQLKDKSNNTYVYKEVINALKHGTNTGSIIEVMTDEVGKETYEAGKVSKQFRLSENYLKAGLEEYLLKDESIIQQRNKAFYKALFDAKENIISSNLISVYQHIELPAIDEIISHGRHLANNGYITKKGKKLTMRNRHKNHYWRDADERSFVEDNIELYQFLTSRGFMIPVIGGDTSGGRVVDSFNLMPSWIRAMIKINNEPIVECDFSAMHPNLASKLYGGTGNHISHQEVADYLGIDKASAKKEHLSFFNKPHYPSKKYANKGSMIQSKVYQFYKDNEPVMLDAIKADKMQNGYIATTFKLFKLEVQLMTKVIQNLNRMGIFVLYVYDALYCCESQKEIVLSMMNKILKMNGINTKASL